MKKILLLAVALVMMLPAAAQEGEKYPSFIQVTGRAEREVTPDEFDLAITIDERDSKGKLSVEQQQRDMVAALKRLGIDTSKQLTVADLGSEFFKRNSATASASYRLRLNSAEQVTAAWQALGALGISKVNVARAAYSKIDELREEVRVAAMRNARSTAATLAGAVGQSIGKCFYIYDTNNEFSGYYNNAVVARAQKNIAESDAVYAIPEPLEFKAIKVQYYVQAKFVLE